MKSISFKESNATLQRPPNMTDEECSPLNIFRDGKQCISCWRPSWRERLSILFYGRVWLCVLIGTMTQPPVWTVGAKTVFEKASKEKR